MARNRRATIDQTFDPECEAALDRVTRLAHRCAATLFREKLSSAGEVRTPHAWAMAMGMLYFLLRIGPADLHAIFLSDRSIGQFEFKPFPPDQPPQADPH